MRNKKQNKLVERRCQRWAARGYRDGMCGIKRNEKLIPAKYRKAYDNGHTEGMVDIGSFTDVHGKNKVA